MSRRWNRWPGRFLRRKGVRRALVIAALLLALPPLWAVWMLTVRYEGRIYALDALEAVPERKVAIVFGAGYWNERPSTMLRDRLDTAIALYRAGKVEVLLFSGDNRFVDYNEPAVMLDYALEQGIPRSAIVLDYAGRRTYDTCYRARAIFRVEEAILVTQRYHLPRALYLCDAVGPASTVGVIADSPQAPSYAPYILREFFALWRSWLDVHLLHPLPVLGDPLPIP